MRGSLLMSPLFVTSFVVFLTFDGVQAAPFTLWSVRMTEAKTSTTFGPPTPLQGNMVAFFVVDTISNGTWLAALNSTNGEQIWKVATTFVQPASGWVEAGHIGNRSALFAGTDDGLIALEAATGSKLWEYKFTAAQEVPAHPTFFDGRVYFTFENGNYSSPIVCVDAFSGAKVFETEDLAFSKIWTTDAGLLVYCSLDPAQYLISYPQFFSRQNIASFL